MRSRVALLVALTTAVSIWGAAFATSPATAQQPSTVSLRASSHLVDFGRKVTLSGKVSPPQSDQLVNIVDGHGRKRAAARTDQEGRYSVAIAPSHNSTVRAEWVAAVSNPVTIGVRSLLTVHLKHVRLFGKAGVVGSLRPAHPGARVRLTALRDGRKQWSKKVALDKGTRFFARLPVKRVGSYRIKASFGDRDHARAVRRTAPKSTPLPRLSSGSRGVFVRLLERRLHRIQYHVPRPDRSFDYRTADAVTAFNKVQGRARVGYVDASTWRGLASPFRPRPRASTPRLHIEVDQTRQVLYVVRKGKIADTIHVSTGAGGGTFDGVWHVYRKIAGYSPHRLYYPSYYEGARAIHGWPEVPTYPASHGCVRVPYWTAKWIYRIADLGTEVRIYH
jgi:hypothetical protein